MTTKNHHLHPIMRKCLYYKLCYHDRNRANPAHTWGYDEHTEKAHPTETQNCYEKIILNYFQLAPPYTRMCTFVMHDKLYVSG